MQDKGVVAHRREGRQFVYRAVVREEDVQRTMVGDVVQRLFGGDPSALISHLVEEGEIDADELKALSQTLHKRKETGQ
jgi:predicted transcriptional regulator